MPRRALPVLAVLVCWSLLSAGCGRAYNDASEYAAGEAASPAVSMATESVEAAGEFAEDEAGVAGADATAAPDGVKPRIIYTADVRLVAEDFAKASEQLQALVKEVDGYVASARLDRSSGASRSGTWTIRVPVTKYGRFLESLDALAFVESRDERSEDVTMEYVDVEARIANLKRLEERFIALLAEKTGKLEDILHVEQELARVRGDIEQAQGRLRYLTNKTDYSTVTVAIREQKDYQPPKAPLFGERIATTWSQSLTALRKTAEAAVLVLVAVVPWLLVASLFVFAVVVTIRLALRRRSRP